ncbi:hypothetical protein E0L21_10050 [Kosakonia quasisacchari]|uniref:Uncharacterized protein n=1 Tax=Kosakonia quasisacchari TaxID=2529380 RepID=A0A4R0HP91_9ENTR|nr:hypothetical protein [Kosakonia quasisacchari]TCC09589.1 hypothetical protein E0L21_10050 [Kosakonia quasisacchari]
MTNNDEIALKLKQKAMRPDDAGGVMVSCMSLLAMLAERDADKKRIAELVSAIGSINHAKHHEMMIPGDDEPVYWQRKEWVEWILELAAGINLEVGE